MESHACLWESMGVYGSLWGLWEFISKYEYVGLYGNLWRFVRIYGNLWMFIEVYGSLWESGKNMRM